MDIYFGISEYVYRILLLDYDLIHNLQLLHDVGNT